MKKQLLLKGIAAMAVAFTAVSCHSGWGEVYDENYAAKEFKANFSNIVMGGQEIDAQQTWNTAVTTRVSVKATKTGTLKIYTQNPIGNPIAPLYTGQVTKGATKLATLAKPQDVTTLYATVTDADGYIVDNMAFAADNAEISIAFGDAAAGSSRAAAPRRRTIESKHTFATAPADGDFATKVPGNALPEDNCNGGGQGVNVVISHATVDYLNLWNAGSNVYFPAGNWVVNGQYVGANSTVYLLPGAHVTFNGEYNLNSENARMYIAQGATFTATKISYNFNLYNRGTINVGNLNQYAKGLVYNEGTITCTGEASPKNHGAEIVNAGGATLTAASMSVEGSAHVLNEGDVTITGDVVVNSNECSWVNNGMFHCKNYYYEAGSSNVINNCKLICDELFSMNLGDGEYDAKSFKLDGSIVAKNFYHGNGHTIMAADAIIKVAETITCNGSTDGGQYGFYGPTAEDKYAVVQAAKITAKNLTQRKSIVYKNHVIIATDDHWAQCDPADGNYPYYILDTESGARMATGMNDFDYTVAENNCNGGIHGTGSHRVEPEQYVYFAFEDLGMSDDFDFNDVVVRVGIPDANGESTVELCALGGTIETYLYCGSQKVTEAELHTVLGLTPFSGVSNNGNTNKGVLVTYPFVELGKVSVANDASVADLNMSIEVTTKEGKTSIITGPAPGDVPFRVVVNGDENGKWFWPRERRNISDAFPEFGLWGANYESNPDWYKTYIDIEVVKW